MPRLHAVAKEQLETFGRCPPGNHHPAHVRVHSCITRTGNELVYARAKICYLEPPPLIRFDFNDALAAALPQRNYSAREHLLFTGYQYAPAEGARVDGAPRTQNVSLTFDRSMELRLIRWLRYIVPGCMRTAHNRHEDDHSPEQVMYQEHTMQRYSGPRCPATHAPKDTSPSLVQGLERAKAHYVIGFSQISR